MDAESGCAVVFIFLLILFIYTHRKKITVQKLIFPVLYFVMYRTRIGLKLMTKTARRFRKPLHYLSYVIILVGFGGMVFITYALVRNIYKIFTQPAAMPGVGIVLPIQAKGVFYVPFFYWIISIFILAVVHEFSHGVLMRTFKVRIKSSGLAFLSVLVPVVPAAFVEPNEKHLAKKSAFQQLGVLGAGSFANIALGIILLVIFNLAAPPVMSAMIDYEGVRVVGVAENQSYPAEAAGLSPGEVIHQVNNITVKYHQNFTQLMKQTQPGETLTLITNQTSYKVELATHPANETRGYLGLTATQNTRINPGFRERFGQGTTKVILWFTGRPYHQQQIYRPGLISWLILLNVGIGLFNLAPLGPIDGGRMLMVALQKRYKKTTAQKIWKAVSLVFLIIILINLGFAFVK